MDQLIEISRFYGDNPAYVIAGGGNTSLKDQRAHLDQGQWDSPGWY